MLTQCGYYYGKTNEVVLEDHNMDSDPTIWKILCTGIGCRGGLFTRPDPDTMAHCGQVVECLLHSENMFSHHQCLTNIGDQKSVLPLAHSPPKFFS